ncbi:proline-rich nuclear receptor coactivator 1 [Rhinophrynus dorsalis]
MSEPGGMGRKAGGSLSKAQGGGRRRGRNNKIRSAPFPTRIHQPHHHPLQKAGEPCGHGENSADRTASPGPGASQPIRPTQYRQLRRDVRTPQPPYHVLKTKMVKSEQRNMKYEKNNSAHSSSAYRCEQRNFHKQKNKCNIPHTKANTPNKSGKLQTESELVPNCFRKPHKKPLTSAENVRNLKPNEDFFPKVEAEKEISYAGAKFSDPPSPSVLPKPPSHWMGRKGQHSDQCKEMMTFHLKTLLKVQL